VNDFWASVIGGSVGVAGTATLFWAVFRHIVVKKIDQYFDNLKTISSAQVQLQQDAAKDQVHHKLNIYPQLSRLVYMAKNEAKSSWQTCSNDFCSPSSGLRECCRELVTNLYSYRIYLPANTFRLVHDYKNQLQDILNDMDWLSRPHHPRQDDLALVSTRERIEVGVRSLEPLCEKILEELGGQLRGLQGPLS
jgi:hypothetical protein